MGVIFKGKYIKLFLSKFKWDFALIILFFSDSTIIILNNLKHLSAISIVVFSFLIKSLHLFNNLFVSSFDLYILNIILIALLRTFSSFIWNIIFHNLSSSWTSSTLLHNNIISNLSSLMDLSKRLYLFIFINRAINNLNSDIDILLWSLSINILNNWFIIIPFFSFFISLSLAFSTDIYFFINS